MINKLIKSSEPARSRQQFVYDLNSGKARLFQEENGSVKESIVDKEGGYIKHFHQGVTGFGTFKSRMLNYMTSNDKSVTAIESTESLRKPVVGCFKNSITRIDTYLAHRKPFPEFENS